MYIGNLRFSQGLVCGVILWATCATRCGRVLDFDTELLYHRGKGYTKINAETIDRWIEEGWQWGQPIDTDMYLKAKKGEWSVLLTPTKPVPLEWFSESFKAGEPRKSGNAVCELGEAIAGEAGKAGKAGESTPTQPMRGLKILGLAAGGGQQMPIFAALGAECTVMDYSSKQIESEIQFASQQGYSINAICGDMTKTFPFANSSFDLIFHPVANCYVEEVQPIWNECYRVLKRGGRLLAGLDNGINFIVGEDQRSIEFSLPFNPLKDKKLYEFLQKDNSGVQFSHTLEEQIRGQIQAGFCLKDLYEDTNGSGYLHEKCIPTFWATFGVK